MKTILSLLVLAVSAAVALADGKTDPGYDAAYQAALKGQRVKLAIGPNTVSTVALRCGSIDGYEDGIVEVYPKADGSVGWSAKRITPALPDTTVFPNFGGCPGGTCPNQPRYFR